MTAAQTRAAFIAVLGMEPRQADLEVLELVEPGGVTAGGLAAYIWDHWLGEPNEPSEAEVLTAIEEALAGGSPAG
jgi:hypothetical protein